MSLFKPSIDRLRRRGTTTALLTRLDKEVRWHGSPEAKQLVVALGELRDSAAIDGLVEVAYTLNPAGYWDAEMGVEIVTAIEACGGPTVPAALDRILDRRIAGNAHAYAAVRLAAVAALSRINSQEARDCIRGAICVGDPALTEACARALVQCGDELISSVLVDQLCQEWAQDLFVALANEELVIAATGLPYRDWTAGTARAIGTVAGELADTGRDGAVRSLVEALSAPDSSWTIRTEAARQLRRNRWRPQGDEERAVYYVAAGRWTDAAEVAVFGITALIEHLGSTAGEERYRGAVADSIRHVLANVSDPQAMRPLTLVIQDERYAFVAEPCLIALEKILTSHGNALDGGDLVAITELSSVKVESWSPTGYWGDFDWIDDWTVKSRNQDCTELVHLATQELRRREQA